MYQPRTVGFPLALTLALIGASPLHGHPLTFNSTITYSATQPATGAADSVNWSGATFDAANIGGSGVNADGGANNGAANDASTRVAGGQPIQGQTFTTGSDANGYDVTGITVRMAGYTTNTASGSNLTSWNLDASNGPIHATIAKINGTTHSAMSVQNFMAGGTGNPGSGNSANGAGTYLTFNLPFPVHLEPNTTYGFDVIIGNGSSNHFEWLGTSGDPYAGGTAYTRTWGGPITAVAGDRVFQVNMTASTTPYAPFVHPGALHTQADFDRMKAKIAAGAEPWKTSYDWLAASPYAQTSWGPAPVEYIIRGGSQPNNYTRSQRDAQAIYQLSLRWKLTGDATYANRAVVIANAWSARLLGIGGDSNASLAAGICGYLFAIGGEILSTYPGWPAAEKQAYKDMMMRVFYPGNADFLWRHHNTPNTTGGNTHYRLNWDTSNMASMAAIGILCDNRAVYQQAVDYFKYGPGNSRVERAAWYIYPDGTAQTEESGRDQPHNKGGWYAMALLCQMAWNQGDDLFGYDNNRVLRAHEYNAKYNNGADVPWVFHRNASLSYTETLSESGRYPGGYTAYEIIYNHYANVKGIAAPWNKLAMHVIRPEGVTGTGGHPSAQDHLGLGSLTYARDETSTSTAPGGLRANWSKNQVTLSWWGSATATSYQIQRAISVSGPYATLGTAVEPNLNFTDTAVANGGSYYYKVVALTPSGNLNSAPLAVSQSLVTRYTFENTFNDVTGTRHGTAMGGSTGAANFATGKSGQAANFDGVDDYIRLPVGSGNYQDITIATWIYWNGGNAWQRVFDFGSEIEKYMMLTVNAGSNLLRFQMTTSRGTDGTLTLNGPTMPTATWTHVAITLNGDTATMYVNGTPITSGTADRVDPLFSQTFCYLGRSMFNNDSYFKGRIDDFRIYNYALTGAAVYNLWGQSTNQPPVFTKNPMVRGPATQGTPWTNQSIYNSATDPDGGTLIYSKVGGPAWLNIAANGAISGTPANSDNGLNLFVVRVTDASGATDDAILRVTVNNTNEGPTWSSSQITKQVVTRGQPYTGASLSTSATDPDLPYGDVLVFTKLSGPSWLTISADGALSGTPAAVDVGSNSFTVRVTDSGGLSANATLSITVLPYILRSQFSFEGNAVDEAALFSGTVYGSPSYPAGRIGQAISMNGTTDYVTLPDGVADYQDITVAAWVYWKGGGSYQRIFDFGNSTSQYLYLSPESGGSLRFAIKNGTTEQQVNTASLPTGRWIHVAVTLSGSTATLYVNGLSAAANSSVTIDPDDFHPALNYIGKSQYPDPLFNGLIDDVRIYNYGLSASEVSALVGSITPPTPTGAAAVGGNGSSQISISWTAAAGATSYIVRRSSSSGGSYTTVYSGSATSYSDAGVTPGITYFYLVTAVNSAGESLATIELSQKANIELPKVHLRLDETEGVTAADASGNGWNGTVTGGPIWATGKINNAMSLSGSSNYASLPGGVVSGLGNCTIAVWVELNSISNWARIVDFGTGTNNYMYIAPATASGNRMRFAIRTPSVSEQQINSSVNSTTGNWTHVAVTISGSVGTLYINGAVAGTNSSMTLTPSSLGATTQNYLGKSQFADPYLNGLVDEFQVYGRALSASEITALASPLAAPTDVLANAGDGQNILSWSPVSGATGYNIKRSSAPGEPYVVVAADSSETSHIDGGLTNGVAYYYVVSALKGMSESPNSTETAATPLGAPPVPTNVAASGGDGVTSISWAESGGATGYNIKRSTVSGEGYTTVGTSTAESYADTSVVNSTTYYYVVTAVGPNGESAVSAQVATTPLASPAAPTGLATAAGNSTITLSWTPSATATSYTIKRSLTSGSDYEVIATTEMSTYLNAGLINGTPYYYVVSAANSAGDGADSAEITGTPVAPPIAPTGTLGSAGDGQAGLFWQTVNGAISYIVRRSTQTGGPYTTVASDLTSTSFYDTSVANGTTYYYVILAVNEGGEGALSSQITVKPNNNPLRANLRFDELSGTDAADSSGNGWNGTLAGGSAWNAGKLNNAINLSGSANYIALPKGVTAGLTSFTVATWIKLNSISTWARIFDFGTGTNNYMHIAPATSAGNKMRFAIRTPAVSEQQINTSVITSTGVWTHVAVTISGSVGTLYINGAVAGTNSAMTLNPASLGVTTQNYIGRSQFVDPYLNGQVDEFQIYGRALAAAEIASLYAHPAAPSGLAATGGNGQIALTWNAVSGASGYTIRRSYLSGGPYVAVASVASVNYTDTDLATGSPYYYVVSALAGVAESANSSEVNSTTLAVPQSPAGVTAIAGDSLVNLSWTSVAGATSYQVKRSTSSGGPYTLVPNGGSITSNAFIDGGLANGTTYYYVVSASNAIGESVDPGEVSAMPWSDLRLHLKCDETSGSYLLDSSGRGIHGATVNGPAFLSGKINNAIRLTQSSSQYATLPSGLVNGIGDISITCWINLASVATWQRIFDFGTGTSNYMFLAPQYATGDNANKLRFAIRTPSVGEQRIDSGTATPSGWVHVAVVLSGNTGQLYLNGTQVGVNNSMTLTPASLGNTTQNYLGKSQFASDPYLNASQDDFRIYGRALTASEVSSFLVPLVAPQNVTATASPETTTLAWEAVPNATRYVVKYSTSSSGPYSIVSSNITSTGFVHSGLTPGVPVYYVVSGANFTGEGPESAVVTSIPTEYTPLQTWQISNFGSVSNASAAPGADPDFDGLPNLLEFATESNPNATDAASPATINSNGGFLTLQFRRLEPAPETYTVEASQDLVNWTIAAALSAGQSTWTGPATVTESGSGSTRLVTVKDTVPISSATRRFLRLRVGTGIRGTVPQGSYTLSVAGGVTSSISIPLESFPVARGLVQSVSGSSVTLPSAEWGAVAGSRYSLRFLSGSLAGAVFPIASVNGNSASLTLPSGATLEGQVTTGDRYVVQPIDTLGSFFGSSSVALQTSATVGSADTVQIWSGSAWLVFYHNGTNWRVVGSPASQNHIVVDGGMQVTRRGAAPLSFTVLGQVHEVAPKQFIIPGGSTFLAAAQPVETSLASLGFRSSTGWLTSSTVGSADTVQVWNGNAWLVFYHNGANWRQVGSPANQNNYLLTQPLFITRKSAPSPNQSFVVQPLPYTP